ncbi:hypothetical protein [Vasconcelosia minhoensis]|nr:hypothetical protein [Romeria gracilis]
MNTELLNGLEVIFTISAMTAVLCPIFCWVLPNRARAGSGAV